MRNLDLFLSIGKEVKDEYGRIIGEVVSLAAKPQGDLESLYVKRADGKFTRYPASSIVFNGSEVIIISDIKAETEMFCDRIPLIWRKSQALKELAEKNRISPDLYDELQRSFEGALNQLKSEAKNLIEKINMEIERCHKEIRELNYALVHLEVEHEIGQINDQSYELALSRIQDCLRRVNNEKADLEAMKSRLSNILLGEFESTSNEDFSKISNIPNVEPVAFTSTPLPTPPPVVVYVNETEKSNI